MSGRVFGASLKPAWSVEQINEFLDKTRGDVTVFVINHDKDETEAHTHFYLEYSTPRKISTVANLLGVESNFIELVKNKKGYLRYLTHKDETEKHKYDDSEVLTNSEVSYATLVLGNSLSDKEIAQYIVEGRGIELLGVVSSSKLRTIQSFIHFDNSNMQLQQIRLLNEKMDAMTASFNKIEQIAVSLASGVNLSLSDMVNGMQLIASEIAKTRAIAATRKKA
jgi:hypothetical protein